MSSTNRYTQACVYCGHPVYPAEGKLWREHKHWRVAHYECHARAHHELAGLDNARKTLEQLRAKAAARDNAFWQGGMR